MQNLKSSKPPVVSRIAQQWLDKINNEKQTTPAPNTDEFLEFARRCYVRSGTRLIRFDPWYDYQIAIARLAEKYRGFVIVKDRQLGVTESIICWMLARSLNPAYAGAVFSITEKDALKVSQRVKRMPSKMPEFEWETDSVGIRKPKGGGELNFRPSTKNATRGLESIWDIFIDEAGFIPIVSEMYAASAPSQEMVGDDARTFIVSTIPPEGRECWFWEQLESATPKDLDVEKLLGVARDGGFLNRTAIALPTIPGFIAFEDEAGWCKIIIGHKAHPIYGSNPHYVDEQRSKKKLSPEQAEREHNLGLPKQGGSLFNPETIARNSKGFWLGPIPHHAYLMAVDPNFGAIGGDYFVVQVWDITRFPAALCFRYRDNEANTTTHRKEAAKVAELYRPCLAAVEHNGGGQIVAENLLEDCPWLRVEVVKTGALSKRINSDRVAIAIENDEAIFPDDWEGIKEASKFSKLSREALSGHDDEITCWMAAWAWLEEAYTISHQAKGGAVADRTHEEEMGAIASFL